MAKKTASKPAKRRWTVMVFMGADGVEGNVSLADEAKKDIAEMARVGSGGSLNILVQVHDAGTPRRLHIGKGAPIEVPVDQRKLVNGEALSHFVSWALSKAHRPGDYTMLVLWGHAYRFGLAHTETRAGIDAIDFAELAGVLRTLQKQRKTVGGETPTLDIVAFDACDLATIEMSVQLQQFAKYLLASQIGIPLPGWPYDRILIRLKKPRTRLMGPAEFGTYVVRRFCEEYHADERPVSLTLLDLNRATELSARTEVLALRLALAVTADPQERHLVYELFRRSYTDDGRPFIDVADLCLNLMRHSSDVFVRQAAASLGDFLLSPPPDAPPHNGLVGAKRPFIVEHGRNNARTAKLNGISLYAPHVSENHDWEGASYWYQKFVFVQETLWSKLVHTLAHED